MEYNGTLFVVQMKIKWRTAYSDMGRGMWMVGKSRTNVRDEQRKIGVVAMSWNRGLMGIRKK